MKNEQLSAQLAKIRPSIVVALSEPTGASPSSVATSPQERSAAVKAALAQKSEQLISEAREGETHEGAREG